MVGSLEMFFLSINPGDWDVWLFRSANGAWIAPWADGVFLWLTAPPCRILLFLFLWSLFFFGAGRKGRRVALLALLVVAVSDQMSSSWIKPWVDRVRPCFVLPETRLLVPHQSGSASFPSSHATNTFAVAVLLLEVHPIWGVLGLLSAGMVSYSRVYVGVHYPSDILAGAVLGSGIAASMVALDRLLSWLRCRL